MAFKNKSHHILLNKVPTRLQEVKVYSIRAWAFVAISHSQISFSLKGAYEHPP